MFERHTRTNFTLAALLAAALALPGLAAARGDDDWGDGRRGDWKRDRDNRDWVYLAPRHHHRHKHHRPIHRGVVVVEEPVYLRPRPRVILPAPPLWGDDGITVIRRRTW